jgi:hypothetical protein
VFLIRAAKLDGLREVRDFSTVIQLPLQLASTIPSKKLLLDCEVEGRMLRMIDFHCSRNSLKYICIYFIYIICHTPKYNMEY